MLVQISALNQRAEVLLECVPAGAGQLGGLTDGDAAMLARKLDDLQRKFWQRGQHDLFPLNLFLQPPDLLGQGVGDAFRSDDTPPFEDSTITLARASGPASSLPPTMARAGEAASTASIATTGARNRTSTCTTSMFRRDP